MGNLAQFVTLCLMILHKNCFKCCIASCDILARQNYNYLNLSNFFPFGKNEQFGPSLVQNVAALLLQIGCKNLLKILVFFERL